MSRESQNDQRILAWTWLLFIVAPLWSALVGGWLRVLLLLVWFVSSTAMILVSVRILRRRARRRERGEGIA